MLLVLVEKKKIFGYGILNNYIIKIIYYELNVFWFIKLLVKLVSGYSNNYCDMILVYLVLSIRMIRG